MSGADPRARAPRFLRAFSCIRVFLTPVGVKEPHWLALKAECKAGEERAREALAALSAARAASPFRRESGTLVRAPGPIGSGKTAGCEGTLRTESGEKIRFVAFGEPGRTLARLSAGARIEIGGTTQTSRRGEELKVNIVQVKERARSADAAER